MQGRAVLTEHWLFDTLRWELEHFWWLGFLTEAQLEALAGPEAHCSDSTSKGHALHGTAFTNEEFLHTAQYQDRWRFQVRKAPRHDATKFPESWTADHGTPKLGLLERLSAQPRRKAVRTLKSFATTTKPRVHRAYW